MATRSGGAAAATRVQLALDRVDLDEAMTLISELGPSVARVEAGTPLLLRTGLRAVTRLRAALPSAVIVADGKICDAGAAIAADAYAAGADVVTVVAAAADSTTWEGVLQAARDARRAATGGGPRRVAIDTIGLDGSTPGLAHMVAAAEDVPVEICIHRPRGVPAPFAELLERFAVDGSSPAFQVAGSLTAEEIIPALAAGFSSIVVGSAVTAAADPTAAWRRLVAAAVGPEPGD